MSGPINPDPEQQRADNNESRRQSGLEPRPEDQPEKERGSDDTAEKVRQASGGEPAADIQRERGDES